MNAEIIHPGLSRRHFLGRASAGIGAAALAWLPRLIEARRFRQRIVSAIVHPLAVAVFLAIQWVALVRKSLGLKTAWRGRALAPQ
jgi:hypothetical protein